MTRLSTPAHKDKRFLLVVGVIAAVFAVTLLGKAPPDGVLAFFGVLVTGYIGQSQWGKVKAAEINGPEAPSALGPDHS